MNIRIGYGFDVHQLAEKEEFWLGGLHIEHTKGGVGHSDADVLLHAICDALFGALALGDIGKHFPDTDNTYKGIDSKILLHKTYEIIQEKGYSIGNLDTTICLQSPKIAPYIVEMRKCIASLLNTNIDNVSVKATTTEKLGFEGREEGVSAHATVLLVSN